MSKVHVGWSMMYPQYQSTHCTTMSISCAQHKRCAVIKIQPSADERVLDWTFRASCLPNSRVPDKTKQSRYTLVMGTLFPDSPP